MVRLLARVIGVGVETADMLVQEVLSRNLRDRRAVARYGGLTALLGCHGIGHQRDLGALCLQPSFYGVPRRMTR